MRRVLPACIAVGLGLFCCCGAATYMPGIPTIPRPLGNRLPIVAVLPFAGLILSIAILPLVAADWWHSNINKAKVSALFAIPLAFLMGFHFGKEGTGPIVENLRDYVSLMALLASLFVISAGIYLPRAPAGTPLNNTSLLAIGAVLANAIGTTGASLLLIRPLVRANHHRPRAGHVIVFFIFIVSNCGGLLTPLGDPPLFLGHLGGIPFLWTMRLWPQWALVNGLLLSIFLAWDHIAQARERREEPRKTHHDESVGVRFRGGMNIPLLVAVAVTVYLSGRGIGNHGKPWPFGIREALLAAIAATSYFSTSRKIHQENRFSFGPLIEVAVVFVGLFITMTPALLLLDANAAQIGLNAPAHFFWASGLLSSVLDNAPTYLAFAATACGAYGFPAQGGSLGSLLRLDDGAQTGPIVAAISCGCVFMGALTYIGNGPNLLVKAVADDARISTPGFFRYLIYSSTVLVPLFVLVTILFFRV